MVDSNPRDHLISEDMIRIQNEYLQLSHEDTKELRIQLLEMGFNLSIINMVFCFYTIKSIDDAISYMTKIDDVWQHHYTNVDNKCLICGENGPHFDHHETDPGIDEESYREMNKSRISKSFLIEQERRKSYSGQVDDVDEEELCSVCFCENIEKNLHLSIKCGHKFCLTCWENYVSEAVKCGKVLHIKCIDVKCKGELTENDVFVLLGEKEDNPTYEKYKRFLKRRQNESSGSKKQCPIRDCEGYGKKDKDGNKYIKCENGHKFCYECLRPWHGSSSCDEIIDKDFFRWKKKKVIKKCPNCFFWTEKNEGCNHMTCCSCHFQWCWICEKKYTTSHYQNGDCAGLQFTNAVVINNHWCFCCYQMFKKVMFFYLLMGLLILSSIIGAPFFAAVFIYTCYLEDFDFDFIITTVMIMATGILVSLIFQPFISSIGAVIFSGLMAASVFFPPVVCYLNKLLEEGL